MDTQAYLLQYDLVAETSTFTRNIEVPMQVEERIRLLEFVKKYHWLANAHVVDFFTRGHWTRLEDSWQTALTSDVNDNQFSGTSNANNGSRNNYPSQTGEYKVDDDADQAVMDRLIQLAGHWTVPVSAYWCAIMTKYE
jgi:hypothetical protein